MQNTVLTIVLITTMLAGGAAGQETPPPREVQQTTPTPPAAPTSRAPGTLVNIRLDLTITDQRGEGAPVSKTVTMVLADREAGRIRSEGRDASNRPVTLNVDSRAEMVREGRTRVSITLEYRPQFDSAAVNPLSETLTAILEDGKPLVVSQSADPATDRKVRVELKATVLK